MPDSDFSDPRLIDELTAIVSKAAAEVVRVRAATPVTRTKADSTPATNADDASEALILESLRRLLPGLAIVSEEVVSHAPPARCGENFVIVDPLDGTREFIGGRDEFTINIAIIHVRRPIVGLIAAPALHRVWRTGPGQTAELLELAPGATPDQAKARKLIRTRKSADGITAVVSRSHLDADTSAFLTRIRPAEQLAFGSALKFCRIAEGAADVYPRFAPTCEWDVAAGEAILRRAGGTVLTPDGENLVYGRAEDGFRIPAFIAQGDPAWAGSKGH